MSLVVFPETNQLRNVTSTRLYTAEEFEFLPLKDRCELIRGELFRMPNNSSEHGRRTSRLTWRVAGFVEENNLGDTFVAETRFTIESDPDTVLGPDFSFVAKGRVSVYPETGYLRLTPDLILETKSPSETRRGYAEKISHWLSAGAKVVWALDPKAKTLTIHRKGQNPVVLTEADTLTCEELLPGFSLPLSLVFE